MYHAAPTQATIACLDMARRLAPPQAIIHVGAGYGQGALHQWHQWQVPQARVIDADRERLQWMHDLIATQEAAHATNWQALQAVVAEREGSLELQATSYAAEDGLMDAHILQSLWPNLRTLGQSTHSAQTLDAVLAQHPLTAASDISEQTEQPVPLLSTRTNWLIVECLPALRVLQGAIQTLGTVSTVCLRVLSNTASTANPTKAIHTDADQDKDAASASLEAATAFLATHGFTCVHLGETNHPAVGEALFVRSDIPSLSAERNTLHQTVAELTSTTTALQQNHAEQNQRAATLQAQLENLGKENASVVAQRDELLQKLEQQAQSHQGLESDLAKNRQTLSEAQTAHAAAQKTAQAQIDQLTQEKQVLQKAQAELTTARDAAAKAQVELQKKLEQQAQSHQGLEADLATNRQTLSEAQTAHAAAQKTAQAQIDQLTQEKQALQKAQAELTAARDAAAKAQAELQNKLEQQAKAHQGLEADLATNRQTLSEAQTAHAGAQKTAQAQIDQLTQEKQALQKAQAELTAARDAAAKTQVELQKKLEQQAKAHQGLEADLAKNRQALSEAQTAHQTAQAQITQLAQDKAALQKARDEQARLATERGQQLEGQQKSSAALTKERDALQQTITKDQHRQQLMQEEMLKADAQLELIKDLLLRESGI